MTTKIDQQRSDLLTYTKGMILPNEELMQLSATNKLILTQITDPKVIQKGPHGDYVPVGYIERCLNFVSNFNRWLKVQREGYETRTNDKNKTIHDAWVIADFYIVLDGVRIERSCYGTRQMFNNPAVSKFAVLEAARSIATKSFADTLGIASDRLSKEFDELRKERESRIIETTVTTDPSIIEDRKSQLADCKTVEDVEYLYRQNKPANPEVLSLFTQRKNEINSK